MSDVRKGLLNPRSGKLRWFQHVDCYRKQAAMAKQTKIMIESNSLLILRGRTSSRAWCSRCGADAEMISLDTIGVISNLDRMAVEEWINSRELHRSQGADGSTQVCLNSLLTRVQNTKTS